MHQLVIAHHPQDVDPSAPMADSPFWAWLEEHPLSVCHVALLKYLGAENYPREMRRGMLNETEHMCYKHIHAHFWWTRLRQPKPVVEKTPEPITPPELISVISFDGIKRLV